jgi:hypothetical protein
VVSGSDLARPTLAQFIRHAELFGTDLVDETAANGLLGAIADGYLDERELRRLRVELDTIEAGRRSGRYRVGRRRRRSRTETRVAAQLLAEDGLTRVEIAEKLGVSAKTIDNALSPGVVQTTQTLRSVARGMKTPANEGVETGGSRPPELGSTMRICESA